MSNNLDREIQAITDEIQQLTLEFNLRTDRLQRRLTRLQVQHSDTTTDNTNQLQLGDIVEITNSYRGKKGVTGTVIHLTKKRVTLRDYHNQSYTRSYNNVRKVE